MCLKLLSVIYMFSSIGRAGTDLLLPNGQPVYTVTISPFIDQYRLRWLSWYTTSVELTNCTGISPTYSYDKFSDCSYVLYKKNTYAIYVAPCYYWHSDVVVLTTHLGCCVLKTIRQDRGLSGIFSTKRFIAPYVQLPCGHTGLFKSTSSMLNI